MYNEADCLEEGDSAHGNRQQGRRDFLKATMATAAGWTIVDALRGARFTGQLPARNRRHRVRRTRPFRGPAVRAAHEHQGRGASRLLRRSRPEARRRAGGGRRRAVHRSSTATSAWWTSKLDAVAVESPPYFHPEQAIAVLQAGKHLYLAKPMAVDVAGCLAIERAARAAGPSRHVLVDFQTRRDPLFREAAARVHRGDIGPAVLGHVYYHAGRLKPQAPEGTATARLRNWVFDKALVRRHHRRAEHPRDRRRELVSAGASGVRRRALAAARRASTSATAGITTS